MSTRLKVVLVVILLSMTIVGTLTWFGWISTKVFESQQIMAGEYGKGPAVGASGHLGGVPVSIPPSFAHFVEYDGDPGFMEHRKGKRPERTYKSGISSFGFEIRYPDMVTVTDVNGADKRKENINTTPWMRVGITSNSAYGYDGNDKTARFAAKSLESARQWHRYELSPDKTYGLTTYVPTDVDVSRREFGTPKGRDHSDLNLYFHQSNDGVIDTYIECGNMNRDAERCKQFFALAPTMKADVWVSYRKGLLPYWREIQEGITQVLLGFRVSPAR